MNKKKFFKTFGIVTVILIAILVILGLKNVFWGNVGKEVSVESLDKYHAGQRENVLLMGTDESGLRSDVIMIFSYSKKDNTVNSISIPRDTKVKIGNQNQKINAALAIGQEDLAIETIKKATGIPIHDFVKISFQGVVDAVDALGGVEFDVPQNMYKPDPPINLKKGKQVLDGKKALQLLRYRDYPMADLARINVQQDFIKAAFEQKAKAKYIAKIPSVYSAVSKNITSSMSLSEMVSFAKRIKGNGSTKIQSFELPTTISSIYVVIDKEKTEKLVEENFK